MGNGQTWSPADYVINGEFATSDDLVIAIDRLSALVSSPIIVAVFSGRWLLRSLSHARPEKGDWSNDVVDRLENELRKHLEEASDKSAFVGARVKGALEEAGCADPSSLVFGGDLERPGGVAVVVGGAGLADGSARHEAELVAACVLGSRPAAFSLDTSVELAILSELRQATERSRPTVPSLVGPSRIEAIDALLRFASTILGTAAIVAYEADQASPYRFVHLDRKSWVLKGHDVPPVWMPSRVPLTPDLAIPRPPELGGSQFASLGELVDHCFASKNRPRRLVGVVAKRHHAYGVPYGFDDVRRRPIGVLCLVWEIGASRDLGPYELAASRMIATHLARGYNTRHSADTVRLVTGQLSYISDLPSSSEARGVIESDEILPVRQDVKLIAPSVKQIVKGLMNLSGAMSVTCRLLSGAGGPSLARYLVRLHSEGNDCTESPRRIALDDKGKSVNAWVARTGTPVYLRTLAAGPESGLYTSPDLASYEGLDCVSIYREGVECELCVPIFAERRVVGTVNLEADRRYAFDAMADTVAEYAQLIGIALLESRRRIGVETVTAVEGFLDYRHRLDAELIELMDRITDADRLPADLRESYLAAVEKVHSLVFMRRMGNVDRFGAGTRISDVMNAAMESLGWATSHLPINALTVDAWNKAAASIYSAMVDPDAARALAFALAQALHNVRDHGGSGDALAGRKYSAMFRFGELPLGGQRNLYVAVSSTCPAEAFEDLDPQRVFREPIDRHGRVSLGAFLAGEALRRCGGSAYLRVTPSDKHDPIVDAEFSVPAAIDDSGSD